MAARKIQIRLVVAVPLSSAHRVSQQISLGNARDRSARSPAIARNPINRNHSASSAGSRESETLSRHRADNRGFYRSRNLQSLEIPLRAKDRAIGVLDAKTTGPRIVI